LTCLSKYETEALVNLPETLKPFQISATLTAIAIHFRQSLLWWKKTQNAILQSAGVYIKVPFVYTAITDFTWFEPSGYLQEQSNCLTLDHY